MTVCTKGVDAGELARDRLVVVVTSGHPLAAESGVSLYRLSAGLVVDLPTRTFRRIQSDQAFEAAGLTRDVACEVTTEYLMFRLRDVS